VTEATLEFLGAAGCVTGSRFLLETGNARVLVDCGLYQGAKALRLRNWEEFPVDPASLDAVVLSHAHIDHCGYLPALVRQGFAGPAYATAGTAALCEIVLPDSGRIHEEDAAHANAAGYSKHHPALPLYSEEDALRALEQLRVVEVGVGLPIAEQVELRLRRAGHILGAASVGLSVGRAGRRLLVSGDLGRGNHPLLCPPEPPPACDVMLVESTYGDRLHDAAPAAGRLGEIVRRVTGRGGVVVIPSFAVDRTELVLMELRRLVATGEIPDVPVFVDSPMALAALRVYRRAVRESWPEVRAEQAGNDAPFDPGRLVEVRDVKDSRELCERTGPCVVVSASGMATGGRVLHHLRARLPDSRNAVVLVGHQVVGTRGCRLLNGEQVLKMQGHYVPVRAEVVDLSAFSVHADQEELLAWMGKTPSAPELAFVVHGEEAASAALAARVSRELRWPAVVPRHGERVVL
jgi:metallo-beta-lactamase family protein